MSETYLTVSDIAQRLSLSAPTVRKYLDTFGIDTLKTRGKWLVSAEGFYLLKHLLAERKAMK